MPAHRERLVPHHRRQRETAADGQTVSLRKLLGDDDGVGLCEKHERIVDDRLVAALQVVISQTAIPGHVDAENQNVALPVKIRPGRRFDDWYATWTSGTA